MTTDTESSGPIDRLDGRYRLVEPVGRGGTATVWRAYDERLNRAVAVKFFDPEPSGALQVRTEVLALARLSHPHIANVFDVGDRDGQPYLVMEFVAGQSLADALAGQDLSIGASVACVAQVAAALAAAHERGIVHRDVTPANVMLTPVGAKLIDFGISAIEGQPEVDPDGGLRGTLPYIAPERIANHAVARAADVYSLGVVLYRALSGRLPWPTRSVHDLQTMREVKAPEPLPDDLPDDVTQLCMRCLAHEPSDRPDAAEAADVLDAAAAADGLAELVRATAATSLEATQLMASRPPSTGPEPTRPDRRRTWLAVGATVLAVAAVGGSVTTWSPIGDDSLPDPVTAAEPSAVAPTCGVTFRLTSDDGQRFKAAIAAVGRSGPLPSGWRLSMELPDRWAKVDRHGWHQVDDTVTSSPQPAAKAGAPAALTLSGSHAGVIALPSKVNVDDRPCDLVLLDSVVRSAADSSAAGTKERKHVAAPREDHKQSGRSSRDDDDDD